MFSQKIKQANKVSHHMCKSEFRAIKINSSIVLKTEFPNLRKFFKTRLTLSQKSTHVHYEVPVKTEGVLGKGFRQEVGMLVLRLYCARFQTPYSQHALAENGDAHPCVSSSSPSRG